MQIGFIGTGSMGSILIEGFIESHALLPSQIIASNRSPEKVHLLAERYPGLKKACGNREVVEESQLVLICVKPTEYKEVLDEIALTTRPAQIVISITSPIYIRDLENHLSCKVARVIPSITNLVGSGTSLVTFSERCNQSDRRKILRLFSHISHSVEISEDITRIASDISSCGPAFVSFLLQKWIEAAVEETSISREEATYLTTQMMIGFGKLLSEGKFSLPSLQQRVCVPGGITGEGIKALDKESGDLFNRLFQTTHAKFDEDINKVRQMFYD